MGGPVPRVGMPGVGSRGLEKCNSADSALPCRRPTSDMSSKAGGKRPATITSEPSNHAMVSEVPPERPGGRVGARSRSARQAAAETGCRGPPRGLSGSSPPLQASRSSRKGIAFGKRSNSMKRNPNAAVTKSGWLYKQVPEPPRHRAGCPPRSCAIPFPPALRQHPRPRVGAALTAPLSQASSGVKQWNKRWFVLVDRCLFYYKGTATRARSGCPPHLMPPPPVGPSGHQLGASMQTQAVSRLGADFARVGKGGSGGDSPLGSGGRAQHPFVWVFGPPGTRGVNAGAFPSLPGSSLGSALAAAAEGGHE